MTDTQRQRPTVLATWTKELLAHEVPSSRDRNALLRNVGVDPATLAARDARIDGDAVRALWSAVTDHHSDPLFGIHFAQRASAASFGVVGYLARNSACGLDAIRRVVAYGRVVKGSGSIELREEGDEVQIVDAFEPRRPPWPRHLTESLVFVYRTYAERWTGRSIVPRRVRFQHAAEIDCAAASADLGFPIQFSQAVNEIVFATSDLRVPFTTHDPALLDLLTAAAERTLDDLPANDAKDANDALVSTIAGAVRADLSSGEMSLARVARNLAIGQRTLQRRLRERSISFHDLVDQIRRAAARVLLANPKLSIDEVAFRLGYQNASGFRRAYKRWTGSAPSTRVPPPVRASLSRSARSLS